MEGFVTNITHKEMYYRTSKNTVTCANVCVPSKAWRIVFVFLYNTFLQSVNNQTPTLQSGRYILLFFLREQLFFFLIIGRVLVTNSIQTPTKLIWMCAV